jgi:UDPglucose--hexose-1-phosphate uridylyltransferase
VFDNDFPALFDYNLSNESDLIEKDGADPIKNDLFKTLPAKGSCKVMCFHPYSDLTLPTMDQSDIVKVIKRWIDLYTEQRDKYEWIQIFENKGEMMGTLFMKSKIII